MQSSPIWSFLTSQLIASMPMLLVFIAAAVAAVIFFKRAPVASGMVLLGVAILALFMIISVAFQAANIQAMTTGRKSSSPFVHQTMNFIFALFRALGTALFIGAAFVERPEREPGSPFTK
jgi:hypothetical protein